MKKISVITICYNAEATVEKTIESVINQTAFDNIEYVIIDGNSTDGTKKIIERYLDKISYYVSESDTGVYNAFSKGVNASTGDYVHFLNANDFYCENNVIEKILEVAEKYDTDFVIGDVILIPNQGEKFYRSSKNLSRLTLFIDWIYHVTLFQKRSLFETYGNFDESFKISSDANWFIPILQDSKTTKAYIEKPIAEFALDGISAKEETKDITIAELEKVLSKNFTGVDDFYRRILQDKAFNKYSLPSVKLCHKIVRKLNLKNFISKNLLKHKNWQINYRNEDK